MIKNFDYHCPYCTEKLKKSGEIVLKTIRDNGSEGIIKMATSIGDYGYVHEPPTEFDPGEVVNFHCPYCEKELNSEEYENYALLKLYVQEGIQFDVLFSRKAGVHKTYLITEDGIETYTGT
jgi:hypothetical protein